MLMLVISSHIWSGGSCWCNHSIGVKLSSPILQRLFPLFNTTTTTSSSSLPSHESLNIGPETSSSSSLVTRITSKKRQQLLSTNKTLSKYFLYLPSRDSESMSYFNKHRWGGDSMCPCGNFSFTSLRPKEANHACEQKKVTSSSEKSTPQNKKTRGYRGGVAQGLLGWKLIIWLVLQQRIYKTRTPYIYRWA